MVTNRPQVGTGQTMPIIDLHELLSSKEAALYLQISMATLYKLTSTRSIPCYSPTGGKLYFKKSELNNWISQGRRNSTSAIMEKTNKYFADQSL